MKIFTRMTLLLGGLLSAGSGVAAALPALAATITRQTAAAVPSQRLAGAALVPPAVLLNVFPNPSQGAITVTLTEPRLGLDYKLRLRNIIGQEVRTFALRPELMRSAGLPLNLSDLPAGLYFYSLLIDNKAVLTKRLTLQ